MLNRMIKNTDLDNWLSENDESFNDESFVNARGNDAEPLFLSDWSKGEELRDGKDKPNELFYDTSLVFD